MSFRILCPNLATTAGLSQVRSTEKGEAVLLGRLGSKAAKAIPRPGGEVRKSQSEVGGDRDRNDTRELWLRNSRRRLSRSFDVLRRKEETKVGFGTFWFCVSPILKSDLVRVHIGFRGRNTAQDSLEVCLHRTCGRLGPFLNVRGIFFERLQ